MARQSRKWRLPLVLALVLVLLSCAEAARGSIFNSATTDEEAQASPQPQQGKPSTKQAAAAAKQPGPKPKVQPFSKIVYLDDEQPAQAPAKKGPKPYRTRYADEDPNAPAGAAQGAAGAGAGASQPDDPALLNPFMADVIKRERENAAFASQARAARLGPLDEAEHAARVAAALAQQQNPENVIIEQDMEFGASLADMDAEMAAQASAVAIANQMQQLMGPDGLSQDEAIRMAAMEAEAQMAGGGGFGGGGFGDAMGDPGLAMLQQQQFFEQQAAEAQALAAQQVGAAADPALASQLQLQQLAAQAAAQTQPQGLQGGPGGEMHIPNSGVTQPHALDPYTTQPNLQQQQQAAAAAGHDQTAALASVVAAGTDLADAKAASVAMQVKEAGAAAGASPGAAAVAAQARAQAMPAMMEPEEAAPSLARRFAARMHWGGGLPQPHHGTYYMPEVVEPTSGLRPRRVAGLLLLVVGVAWLCGGDGVRGWLGEVARRATAVLLCGCCRGGGRAGAAGGRGVGAGGAGGGVGGLHPGLSALGLTANGGADAMKAK